MRVIEHRGASSSTGHRLTVCWSGVMCSFWQFILILLLVITFVKNKVDKNKVVNKYGQVFRYIHIRYNPIQAQLSVYVQTVFLGALEQMVSLLSFQPFCTNL